MFHETEEKIDRRTCATMEVHNQLLEQVPGYRERLLSIEESTASFVQFEQATRRLGVVRIPVVVHIVSGTDDGEILDEQVRSQIDVLNQDFRALNPDRAKVPPIWQGVIADPRVEFLLATTAPDGSPTNGITRTKTAKSSFQDKGNPVKFSASGGADAWPSNKYLNLWVCNLTGRTLGYAQFPGGPPETDGVVIRYSAFGKSGTARAPFNLGRTTTHEVGHWLNLLHIWGDTDDCSGTDYVYDTPDALGPNYQSPSFPHVTCSNGPSGDMFMNYMDYVDDAAMYMFTAGQVARISATLDGPRSEIGQ
jgi:hypothetical protein